MKKPRQRYSLLSLVSNAWRGNRGWKPAWAKAEPKKGYKVVIVGGGGHGLATAFYLAKEHGVTDVAVVERGWIGGGNTGRNTTIVRSNYLWDESAAIYEKSMKLWEGLSQEINFNVMFSQRGVVNLAHNEHDVRILSRNIHANQLNGIDSLWLTPQDLKRRAPLLNISPLARYPVLGGSLQPRGGVARHDAIAWGFARAAAAAGVDIIENCEVTGLKIEGGAIKGLQTSRGAIAADRVGIAVAGHSTVLADMAGFRMPVESHPLQAMVSEPMRPALNLVIMSGAVHGYINQSDKGEYVIGSGIDRYNGYGQRGSFHVVEETLKAIVELYPPLSRVRLLRQWGGIVDTCPDASPILGRTPVDRLFINCGWGTGGFKATPGSGWVFAHTLVHGEPHPLNAPFSLDRFVTGALVDEHGAAGVAH